MIPEIRVQEGDGKYRLPNSSVGSVNIRYVTKLLLGEGNQTFKIIPFTNIASDEAGIGILAYKKFGWRGENKVGDDHLRPASQRQLSEGEADAYVRWNNKPLALSDSRVTEREETVAFISSHHLLQILT